MHKQVILLNGPSSSGDRCPGSAEASLAFLYPKNGCDLTVDTHSMTTKECAECIFSRCFGGFDE